MDLIEDEQLELMDLAAASKGLSSVIQLDHDTLQNLDLYRGMVSLPNYEIDLAITGFGNHNPDGLLRLI